MRLPGVLFLKKLLPHRKGAELSHVTLMDIVWWGFISLIVFFLAVILWNAYFFYSRIVVESKKDIVVQERISIVSEDVDEILRILDERQKKFDEILGQ